MDVSVIIASWNVREHLQHCLQSIFKFTSGVTIEVWVVDNASHDGSADMVAHDFPEVKLIRNATNKGFGAANNQALALATGKYILFLNDDTEWQANILPTLISTYQRLQSNKVGMLGCQLLNADGSIQDSVRRWPTIKDQTITLLKLHHLKPNLLDDYRLTQFNYQQEQRVDQVMGAFMFIEKTLLDQFGSFDEAFFTWFEEVDLQKRLERSGYCSWYTPAVSCIHQGGASFVQWRRPQAQRMFNRSMMTYFKKNGSSVSVAWLYLVQPISLLLAYAAQLVR